MDYLHHLQQAEEPTMNDLIRKRHAGDGWFVFEELGDKPGLQHRRRADMAALGIWASTKYEFHLYEEKISREDVKREMRDSTKVDGVGKYAHYWWLVVSDLKIIADLVIPDAWGILVPGTRGGSRMLTVHRKAPRLKPKPFSESFVVSLIRNMAKTWVAPDKHRALEEELYKLKHPPVTAEESAARQEEYDLKTKYDRLVKAVDAFEAASGVDMKAVRDGSWRVKDLGAAVKLAIDLDDSIGRANFRGDIERLVRTASDYSHLAEVAAKRATALRTLLGETEHTPHCYRQQSFGKGACSCGVEMSEVERKLAGDVRVGDGEAALQAPVVATGDDDPRSGGHRGDAGKDVQDAGPVVRDLGDALPHGEPAPAHPG